ncbi:MAG: RHS repeat-associated core domain-containing protein, partial [Gammaproteobacteria bacterium]|nr:RHS repeat-associated core domain-containing protein [Gammaproteobacteria bacterium]
LARSLADAGGVGALLQIVDHASGKAWHPAYDGNGNIAALVNGATGTVAAVYEYSPYGELLRNVAPDSAAAGQPFRFSTKFTDDETGLVYYGRRYYSPSQGRFLGSDPIEEEGGLNLYGFCGNNSINRWDLLGMEDPTINGFNSQAALALIVSQRQQEYHLWTTSNEINRMLNEAAARGRVGGRTCSG